MIANEFIAKEINQLSLDYGAALNNSLEKVRAECSQQEFEKYRDAVGKVMGYMFFEIMSPLYEVHPKLKPRELE